MTRAGMKDPVTLSLPVSCRPKGPSLTSMLICIQLCHKVLDLRKELVI